MSCVRISFESGFDLYADIVIRIAYFHQIFDVKKGVKSFGLSENDKTVSFALAVYGYFCICNI